MNNGAVTIVYDGDGKRVAKTANGVTTRYLVDDLNPTGYAQVVDELVGGSATRTYSYGIERISQNQIISGTWTPSFYGYDGGGTVRFLANANGAVTDTYDYDAWGNEINSTGGTPNVYLYRGEQWDPDMGMYYLRARYFNPTSGRFLSRDPYAGNANYPATLHRYLYVSANSVNLVDPTGYDADEYGLLTRLANIASAALTRIVIPVCTVVARVQGYLSVGATVLGNLNSTAGSVAQNVIDLCSAVGGPFVPPGGASPPVPASPEPTPGPSPIVPPWPPGGPIVPPGGPIYSPWSPGPGGPKF